MAKHEIFISYAHADNSPLAKGLDGLSDLLHKRIASDGDKQEGIKL
ncbi:MAG TPA: hypothetical protein VFZ34_33150 [Blastocatellia bacterium]|nr:hypothetical protein [Blastocatellia bacterium]